MTTNERGWEEALMDEFCVMFERAEREQGESGSEWAQKVEEFIRQTLSNERAAIVEGIEGALEEAEKRGAKWLAEDMLRTAQQEYNRLGPSGAYDSMRDKLEAFIKASLIHSRDEKGKEEGV